MRKIIILSLLLVSLSSIGQTVFVSKTFCYGVYNEKTKEWMYGEDQPSWLKFTVQGDVIMASDKAKSVYKLGKTAVDENDDKVMQKGYYAKDEKGISCVVKYVLYKETGDMYLYVIYGKEGRSFVYGGLEKEEE
jgi:hypothetical protein